MCQRKLLGNRKTIFKVPLRVDKLTFLMLSDSSPKQTRLLFKEEEEKEGHSGMY